MRYCSHWTIAGDCWSLSNVSEKTKKSPGGFARHIYLGIQQTCKTVCLLQSLIIVGSMSVSFVPVGTYCKIVSTKFCHLLQSWIAWGWWEGELCKTCLTKNCYYGCTCCYDHCVFLINLFLCYCWCILCFLLKLLLRHSPDIFSCNSSWRNMVVAVRLILV